MAKLKLSCAAFLACAATLAANAQAFKTLVSFDGTHGASPETMALVQGIDGNLYGVTYRGGGTLGAVVIAPVARFSRSRQEEA